MAEKAIVFAKDPPIDLFCILRRASIARCIEKIFEAEQRNAVTSPTTHFLSISDQIYERSYCNNCECLFSKNRYTSSNKYFFIIVPVFVCTRRVHLECIGIELSLIPYQFG